MSQEHPRIGGSAGRLFFDSLDPLSLDGLIPRVDELPVDWFVGAGRTPEEGVARFNTRPLYELGQRAKRDVDRGRFSAGSAAQAGERFEAELALPLHEALGDVPGAVLTDRGFWRFLALGPFFACTVWRQQSKNLHAAFGLPPASGRRRRIEGFDLKRNLPWRLFMRAEIGGPSLVETIGADLWWSHIFRVHIGRSHPTARALLAEVGEDLVVVQRAVAPLVTADRGRKAYDALDDDEIGDLVRQQKASLSARTAPVEVGDPDPVLEDDSPEALVDQPSGVPPLGLPESGHDPVVAQESHQRIQMELAHRIAYRTRDA